MMDGNTMNLMDRMGNVGNLETIDPSPVLNMNLDAIKDGPKMNLGSKIINGVKDDDVKTQISFSVDPTIKSVITGSSIDQNHMYKVTDNNDRDIALHGNPANTFASWLNVH